MLELHLIIVAFYLIPLVGFLSVNNSRIDKIRKMLALLKTGRYDKSKLQLKVDNHYSSINKVFKAMIVLCLIICAMHLSLVWLSMVSLWTDFAYAFIECITFIFLIVLIKKTGGGKINTGGNSSFNTTHF
jgi:hypothetical protein